eukprot:CAMPEP_0185029596 /NCGR_PEP_ID=MMETSP1103-20130426/15980_1 /TAXON_ID=36769 /ORGANISM="Paraphysomonas bandaiensis, Strain Caron Lab Isolate" /LENGTH=191 /DNA_ID=CAMNT_0027564401 /DNA_START=432 /DNA_END=1004 /DNA_ORIENTATION=-
MQQIGFAFPGIFSVIMVMTLNMEGDVSSTRLILFYYITAALVLPGLFAWIILCRSNLVRSALEAKDESMGGMVVRTAEDLGVPVKTGPSAYSPLVLEDCSEEENATQKTLDKEQQYRKPSLVEILFSSNTTTVLDDSRRLLKTHPSLLKHAFDDESITTSISTHRWTLFLTISISILQGSLLSYTCGCTLW